MAANFPQRSSSTGKSTINKMLTGDGLSGGGRIKQFEFKASFTDTDGSPLSGAFRYVATDKAGLVKSGETLLLHHDESITVLGLPTGTHYRVEERGVPGWYMFPTSGAFEGEIETGQAAVASFKNSRREFPEDPGRPEPRRPDKGSRKAFEVFARHG